MSQSWHAHWAEDGFRPKRLGNWQVPRWHAQWPDMHCTTTKFEAHKNGRLFTSVKRTENPWGHFEGTWELPLKIDRRTAEELSKATEYKKAFWDAHKAKNQQICKKACQAHGKRLAVKEKSEIKEFDSDDKIERNDNKDALSKKSTNSFGKEKCKIKEACLI